MALFKYSFSLAIILLTITISGCGGGGGATASSATTTSGSFIDDPVENMSYTCSSGKSGKTDSSGKYICDIADSVVFSIGKISLNKILARDGIATPYDIFPTNIRAAVNLARLLQTLDTNTTDDIIYLDENLTQKLNSNLDFTVDPDSFEAVLKGMLGSSITVVSDTVARAKMDASIIEDGGTPPSTENHTPTIVTEKFTTDEDTALNGTLNAIDIDGDALLTFIEVSSTSHGSLALDSDGTFNYVPDENYNGSDSFSFKVNDGMVDSAIATVNITINSVNDAPVITSTSSVTVNENQLSALKVTAEDVDGDSLSFTLGGVDASSFNIDNDGVITFKTAPDYETKNSYTIIVTVSDGTVSVSQDITINISDVPEDGTTTAVDSDNDYIPDNIETLLGMNPNNGDEDGDGVVDGLQSSGTHGDQFFNKEWHIISLGTVVNDSGVATIAGNDLGIKEVYHKYMGYNNGNNIIVQVVDTGVDADHEDLASNMDLSRSLNGEEIGDPSSTSGESHGTMVAGIIAARAFNELGVRGIAPFAKIAGSNWLENATYDALEKAWYSADGANEIAVSSNSWGPGDGMYTSADTVYEELMELGSENLRDKKGRLYVMAAGNERLDSSGNKQADANINYAVNSRYPIIVAALKNDNTYASYSSPGSNILVSGYSGNYYQNSPTIASTTIMGTSSNSGDINEKTTWSEDTKENYTFAMNGTSAATPMVSASIALVLEACPNLTWRDVRYLIEKNAKQIDTSNPTWVQNSAGLWHSRDYGFGLINPEGMIDECTNGYVNLPSEQTQTITKTFNEIIPDDSSTKTFTLSLDDSNIKIEWVEVTIDNDSTYASDYNIKLISPAGTKTTLVDTNQASALLEKAWLDGGFRLSTAAMIDEDSQGEWKIEITDTLSGDSGTLKSIKLQVYGH